MDAYGVGTRLVTGAGEGGGALGGVYKLNGLPRMKLTADPAKSTVPGAKRLRHPPPASASATPYAAVVWRRA